MLALLVSSQLWPHLADTAEMLNLHGQLLCEYILVNVECYSAWTSALAWVDTTQHLEGWVTMGQRERERHLLWSPTLLCPVVPGPIASLWFTLLLSCMHECVLLEKTGDGRWDGEHAGVGGCFAIWSIPCLGCKRGAKRVQEIEMSRGSTLKNVFYKPNNIRFVENLTFFF